MGNDRVTMPDGKIGASIREAIRKLTEGAGPDHPADVPQHGAGGKPAIKMEPGPKN